MEIYRASLIRRVVIADFGIALCLNDATEEEKNMFAGTPGFIAPEVVNHTRKDLYQADSMCYFFQYHFANTHLVFSFGMLMFEVAIHLKLI